MAARYHHGMLEIGNRVRLSAPDRGVVNAAAQVDAVYLPPAGHRSSVTQVVILRRHAHHDRDPGLGEW
jgi:hypothetical protein